MIKYLTFCLNSFLHVFVWRYFPQFRINIDIFPKLDGHGIKVWKKPWGRRRQNILKLDIKSTARSVCRTGKGGVLIKYEGLRALKLQYFKLDQIKQSYNWSRFQQRFRSLFCQQLPQNKGRFNVESLLGIYNKILV